MGKLETVPEQIDFSKEEEKTLERWRREKLFEKTLEQNKNCPPFTFYDGPPFATGLPHYGHLLAGTIKDVVTRWAQQNGFFVERRFGWDTHGLPVEYEVDKTLGIKGPHDVLAMGIDKYNAECRKIVMRYSAEWEVSFLAFSHFVNICYYCLKLQHHLGYSGVMPFSTSCSTPLSNFEAGQNYKDVVDPAGDFLNCLRSAWTTTPWTLPSNLSLVVHPDLDYVLIEDSASGKKYILLEERLFELYKKADGYNVLDRFKGKTMEGKKYQPLFPYFAYMREERDAFRVITGTFVTTDQGTGVVHQAPYFGEIDYQACLENNIITKDMKPICPVDECGKFTAPVDDFKGLYEKGNLIKHGEVKHSYPFCWRSDTPLLYMAVPSWFIRVESLVPALLENNSKTYWVPSFVKDKRFGNWLKDARDWAVSRNRFWGTPINLWVSDDLEEIVCPSSIAELEKLTGVKVTDLHRENVDNLTIPSKTGRGVLHRVSEVFDCWFESGSMPYAQRHYPFENRKGFEENFPADFIAEGIDQTRGWFYTLLVLSTALFNRPPFKNLICNGLILASDGSKMSKRKKNYPDPVYIIEKYGADALRVYLVNSPAVRGEALRFREEGVKDVLKDVFLPWYNAYRFFVQNVQAYEHESRKVFALLDQESDNLMDHWIVSFTHSLVRFVRKEMTNYCLYAVVGPLTKFFDTLTNCYIRLNRRRMKGGDGEEDSLKSLTTLGSVLLLTVRLMAPFTPFFCDLLWQNLRYIVPNGADSVHFERIPEPRTDLIDEVVERRVSAMRSVVDLVRVLRERKGIPVKYPLKELVVINRDSVFLEDLVSLQSYVLLETNVRMLTVSQDKEKYGVKLKADPNFKLLVLWYGLLNGFGGSVLGTKVTEEELTTLLETGKLKVLDYEVTSEEVAVSYCTSGLSAAGDHFETHTVVMLDFSEDEVLKEEGLAREVINRIQKLRKTAKLVTTDAAVVYIRVTPAGHQLAGVIRRCEGMISNATGSPLCLSEYPSGANILTSSSNVKDAQLEVSFILYLFGM
ncbi:unnamed protein product [Enterobius vermicularis]|uniref:isoleucine--tRNA ligase n=1 Tax=Enterobius vermicularis TaxID=51028 RepID=A0A0N4V463_ENTVE|nr:unnamed protein product [Enterobius vermicularis]